MRAVFDTDARLDPSQRAIALLGQRTIEEHYAFVVMYTYLLREEGLRHTRSRFDSVPAIVRPFVARAVRGHIERALWQQGLLRHSHDEIVEAALRDWRAVLTVLPRRRAHGSRCDRFLRARHVDADADRVTDSRLPSRKT